MASVAPLFIAALTAALTLTSAGAQAETGPHHHGAPGTAPARSAPPAGGTAVTAAQENLFEKYHLVLSLTSGLGSPTGGAGVEAEASLDENLALAVGAGKGLSSGPQYAAMIRARRPTSRSRAIGIGLGGSRGDFKALDTHLQGAWWFNGEIYAESRTERGFVFRGFVGLGYATSYESCTEEPIFSDVTRDCNPENDFAVPYIGASMGMAF